MTENRCPRDIIVDNLLAQGMEELVVEEFVEVLDPTFSMQAFQMVWSTCKEVSKFVNPAEVPKPWLNTYQCMTGLGRAELFDELPNYAPKVVHGHITDHPLFSTLAYQASWLNEELRFFYVNLQFLVLCSAIEANRIGEQVSLSAISKACLLTRQLAQTKHQETIAELANLFEQFDVESVEQDDDEALALFVLRFLTLGSYLETHKEHPFFGVKFIGLKTVIATVAGYKLLKEKRDRKATLRGPTFRESFGSGDLPAITVITDTDVDEDTEYQSQEVDGSAPNEVKAPRVQVKAPLPDNIPQAWKSSRQIAYRQKGMLNAIARRNQGLVYQVSRLQRTELIILLENCKRELIGLEDLLSFGITDGFIEALDTQLAVLLLLLTGMPLDDLAGITLVKNNESNNLHLRPAEGGSKILISFVPPKHLLTHIKPEKFEPLVYVPSKYIELPIGDAFYPLLKLAFHLKRLQGLTWDMSLLTTDADKVEELVKEQLKRWNKSANSHLTMGRLSAWLEQAVFEYTGDLAACFYLSNANTHKPAQAYYANYDQQQLSTIYSHVTSKSFLTGGVLQSPNRNVLAEQTIGSRLAAIHNKMQKVAEALAGYVGKRVPGLLKEKIELHNRLVSYIYLMFAFGIGIRSVADPLESINNIDLHSGLILLNDKENRSVTNCRYVFLPAILHQQINAYLQHLKALYALVKGKNFNLGRQIKAAITGESNTPLLFYINSDRHLFERVSPKKISQKLKDLLPVPLNMGRHYLRSELVRRSCPVYWIDALLGHAEIGVEASSRFSAFSFDQLKRLTDEYLEPLVQEVGWQVTKGLGAKHG